MRNHYKKQAPVIPSIGQALLSRSDSNYLVLLHSAQVRVDHGRELLVHVVAGEDEVVVRDHPFEVGAEVARRLWVGEPPGWRSKCCL